MLISPHSPRTRRMIGEPYRYQTKKLYDSFIADAYREMRRSGIEAIDARNIVLNLLVSGPAQRTR